MTQKEFEERIGRAVERDEYVMADAAYMACGDGVDKDHFCSMYKNEAGLHELVDHLSDRVRDLENRVRDLGRRVSEAGVSLVLEAEKIRCGEDGG